MITFSKNNLILYLIFFSLNTFASDSIDISTLYGNEKVVKVCMNKNDSLVLTGEVYGQVKVQFEQERKCNLRKLILTEIKGKGILTINLPSKKSILINSVALNQLKIIAENASEIISTNKKLTLKELNISSKGKLNRLALNSINIIDELNVDISGLVKELNIQLQGIRKAVLDGVGNTRKDSYVKKININNGSINSNKQPPFENHWFYISNLATDEIKVHEYELNNQSIFNYSMSNIGLFGHGIDLNIKNPTDVIAFRDLYFKKGSRGNINLYIEELSGGEIILAEVYDVHNIKLLTNEFPQRLILSNIHSDNIDLELPNVRQSSKIRLGNITVSQSLKSKEEPLFIMAEKNDSEQPHQILGVYDLIMNKAYVIGKEGEIKFLRLKALEKRQLKELSFRPFIDKVFGYILYYLTGFGASLLVPFYSWLFIIFSFSLTYLPWKNLNSKTATNAILGSIMFSLSFGFPSDKRLKKYIGDIYEDESAINLRHKIAEFQGVMGILQLTLISIYFSQTTVP